MPDRDAIRARIEKTMGEPGMPIMEPDAVVMYYPVRGPDLAALLAALATAEEQVEVLRAAIQHDQETMADLRAGARENADWAKQAHADMKAAEARADAAERERDKMRHALAMIANSGLVDPSAGILESWALAALARAEEGGA